MFRFEPPQFSLVESCHVFLSGCDVASGGSDLCGCQAPHATPHVSSVKHSMEIMKENETKWSNSLCFFFSGGSTIWELLIATCRRLSQSKVVSFHCGTGCHIDIYRQDSADYQLSSSTSEMVSCLLTSCDARNKRYKDIHRYTKIYIDILYYIDIIDIVTTAYY